MPIHKISLNGRTLIDISRDTVDKDSLGVYRTAHSADGRQIEGTALTYNPDGFYVDENGILHKVKQNHTPFNLRVMTFNTGGWYIGDHTNVPEEKVAAYTELHRQILDNVNPDIAVFQEYWHYFDRNNSVKATDVIGRYFSEIKEYDAYSESYGKAIASKYFPLTGYTHFRFNVYATTRWFYGFERAYIEVNGKRICIINTWLDSSDDYYSERQAEVAQLLEYVANEPYFILMGDFNVHCESASDQKYIDFYKPFVDAGYNVCNNAPHGQDFAHFPTYYRADGTSEALDNIITSSNITVDGFRIDSTKMWDDIDDKIDHVPFLANLVIN